MHRVLGQRLRRRRGPDLRQLVQRRLAAHRRAGQLHPRHRLGERDQRRDVRPSARPHAGVLEVRPRLAERHAHAGPDAPDARHQRRALLAQGRRRAAGGRASRNRRGVPARPVAEPPRVPQGRPPARREPGGVLALGADREGPRRQRGGAGEDARGRDHDVREVPGGRHDQLPQPDPAHQDDGEHPRPGRLQHRARVHQPGPDRHRQVADRLALAPGLGRQLAVLPPEHRPQRLRRDVRGHPAQRVRRPGPRAGVGGRGRLVRRGHGRRDRRRGVPAGGRAPPTATWWSSTTSWPSSRRPGTRSAASR